MKRRSTWIVLLWLCNHAISLACTNVVGLINTTPYNLCEDQSFHILYDPTGEKRDPGDTLIYVVTTDPDETFAAGGSFIKMLNSLQVNIDISYMTYGTTYYIFALLGQTNGNGGIDFRKGCVQLSGPTPFIFYEIPKPYAGPDVHVCGTVYDLNGIQSITGSNLKWRNFSGGAVQFANDANGTTSVNTQGQYGTFVFELSEENHSCAAADRVSITFNPSPVIQVEEKICIDDNDPRYPYVAIIRITTGQPPFSIVQGNGSINGNIYITDTLASLTNFTVEIRDANGCVSNLVIDNYNCDCGAIANDTIAGKDKKQIGFISKLNATAIPNGLWKQVSGPGNAVFENITNPKSRVRVNAYGKYCFKWFAENDPCLKDTVCIDFYKIKTADPDIPGKTGDSYLTKSATESEYTKSLEVSTIHFNSEVDSCLNQVGELNKRGEYLCVNDNFFLPYDPFYEKREPGDTLIFVMSTDPDPDVAAAGAFIKTFTSQTVIFDSSFMNHGAVYYAFALIGKANGKGGISFARCVQVDGPKPFLFNICNMNCGQVDAGRLDSSLTELCTDQCTTIKSLIPEILDPEDVAMYVFHQSSYNDRVIPRLDTFYSLNDQICFDPAKGMQTGITYYITRVVGNDTVSPGPDKVVDFNDPCLRASNNQPIVWYPYPSSDAGKDIRQRSLIAKLNATSYFHGYWRFVSGPGQAIFEDASNRNSKVRVNAYGKYCFAWAVDFKGCISYDTVCVDFYKIKVAEPDYPKQVFDSRRNNEANSKSNVHITSPTIIDNPGRSYLQISESYDSDISYKWIDLTGRIIISGIVNEVIPDQQIEIDSPVHAGAYLLIIESNGYRRTQKVIVK
jgi:hypothetical protein